MSHAPQRITRAATLALLVLSVACAKKEAPKPPEAPAATAPAPLAVGSIDLGKAIGPDRKVIAASTAFGTRDTIYASVGTTGVGNTASIGAKWTYLKAAGGEIPVNESSQTITTIGPDVIEFHISKASAWPKGKYKVEIQLNGASAGSRDFEIQ